MARLLQCPECGSVVNATAQRMHTEWHDAHNDPTPEVEVGNWPAATVSGDMDFRTPAI